MASAVLPGRKVLMDFVSIPAPANVMFLNTTLGQSGLSGAVFANLTDICAIRPLAAVFEIDGALDL